MSFVAGKKDKEKKLRPDRVAVLAGSRTCHSDEISTFCRLNRAALSLSYSMLTLRYRPLPILQTLTTHARKHQERIRHFTHRA